MFRLMNCDQGEMRANFADFHATKRQCQSGDGEDAEEVIRSLLSCFCR